MKLKQIIKSKPKEKPKIKIDTSTLSSENSVYQLPKSISGFVKFEL